MVDILLKAQFEHDISLIEHYSFQVLKIDISSFNVIKDSTRGANEDIDTLLELSGLIINADAAINCQNFEFEFVVLQFGQFIGHLNCQLPSWCQNDGLHPSRPQELPATQVLDHGQAEGEGLSRSSQITSN